MSDYSTRNIIDFAYDDDGKAMRDALYADIHDRVAQKFQAMKQEIASGLINTEQTGPDEEEDYEDEDEYELEEEHEANLNSIFEDLSFEELEYLEEQEPEQLLEFEPVSMALGAAGVLGYRKVKKMIQHHKAKKMVKARYKQQLKNLKRSYSGF